MFCCMKLLFAMLLSFLLIPFSIATAQDIDSDTISFVQIIQRDNAGNLIGYLEYDSIVILDDSTFQELLNQLFKNKPRIVEVNGIDYELIQFAGTASTDSSGLLSSSGVEVKKFDGTITKIITLAHDGLRSASDEKITVIWNFLRLV